MKIAPTAIVLVLVGTTFSDARRLKGSTQPVQAVAFNGGGFRAHAVHTGLVSGLMGLVEGTGSEQLEKLFGRTQLIGSNSGGTWFSSQLLYSNNFVEMLNELATASSSDQAYQIYNEKWIKKLQSSRRRELSVGSIILEFLEKLWGYIVDAFSIVESWSFLILKYVVEEQLSWQDFVKTVIEIPGDIDSSLSLSEQQPASWVQEKSWAIAGVALSDSSQSILGSYNIKCTSDSKEVARSFSYTVPSSKSVNYPITFSTTLGRGQNTSPYPFISGMEEWSFQYNLLSQPEPSSFGEEWGKTIKSLNEGEGKLAQNLQGNSNKVSMVHAVSTSSAFLGEILAVPSFLQKWDNILAKLLGQEWLTLWKNLLNMPMYMAAGAQAESAFHEGESIRSPPASSNCDTWMSSVAQNQFLTLADGGYADNTGASRLIGSGMADEIILFLNAADKDYSNLYGLFSGAAAQPNYYSSFPIFQQSAADVQAQVQKMTTLSADSSSSLLKLIRFGTIEATTIDQPAFGVVGGRTVLVRVLICDANVGMGSANWDVYPKVVSEIHNMMTNPANKNVLSAELLPWFQQ